MQIINSLGVLLCHCFLQITNVLSIKVSKIVYANWRLSKLCVRSYGVVFCFYFVLVCCDWLGLSGPLILLFGGTTFSGNYLSAFYLADFPFNTCRKKRFCTKSVYTYIHIYYIFGQNFTAYKLCKCFCIIFTVKLFC